MLIVLELQLEMSEISPLSHDVPVVNLQIALGETHLFPASLQSFGFLSEPSLHPPSKKSQQHKSCFEQSGQKVSSVDKEISPRLLYSTTPAGAAGIILKDGITAAAAPTEIPPGKAGSGMQCTRWMKASQCCLMQMEFQKAVQSLKALY